MANTQTNGKSATVDAAIEQVKELNDQLVTAARKAGNLYVDSYEKTVDRAIGFERKVALPTQQEWLKSLIQAQADFTHEVAKSYSTAARSLLK